MPSSDRKGAGLRASIGPSTLVRLYMAVGALICASPSVAQPVSEGSFPEICSAPLVPPPVLAQTLANHTIDRLIASPPPELKVFDERMRTRTLLDWPNLCRYQAEDAALMSVPDAFHGSDGIAAETSVARQFTATKTEALRRALRATA